jgi:hypothetical protein
MAEDDTTEEAQQVIDALKRIEEMEDPVERAVAVGEVLADYKERAPELREMQRQAIEAMRAEVPPVSYRKIAARLKLPLGVIQNIERGHGSAWGTKPRAKSPAVPDQTEGAPPNGADDQGSGE